MIKKLMVALLTTVLAVAGLVASAGNASAATHPSSWAWTATKDYPASQRWELDSPSGSYRAVWQTDHNLVVYHGSKAIWASRTNNQTETQLVFNGTTNLNLSTEYKGNVSVTLWCPVPKSCMSNPFKSWSNAVNDGSSAHRMVMQNDRNFVEYSGSSGGRALWATNTVGK